jgi:hypothetical protein
MCLMALLLLCCDRLTSLEQEANDDDTDSNVSDTPGALNADNDDHQLTISYLGELLLLFAGYYLAMLMPTSLYIIMLLY